MWLLLIIFFNPQFGATVLEHFQSQQDCLIERDRVGFEMAQAYPDEHTFDIVCQMQTVKA